MPDYLDVVPKPNELDEADAKRQFEIQIQQLLDALNRLQENDRIDPKSLEQVVSV